MGNKHGSRKLLVYALSTGVALAFVFGAFTIVKALISDDGQKRKRQVQMVTLMKPPPPPKIKEKPPEPEIKKEEIVEQKEEAPEPEPVEDTANDEPPPGDELGLDADGGAGADGFGLKAKKGGRSLIGGKNSSASLLRRYAWYTRIIQEELRKKINQHMDENGGIPDGELKAIVKIQLDDSGNIVRFTLSTSSGNSKMDAAVRDVLAMAQVSEPPPRDMPRTIKLKIAAKG
jgi:TonB family protein